ncbi:MAG: TraR/DksA C4-type zinc finger protein [Candidatus Moranbacteria bacterium]|nr:TraR/DksA C4-type zinc finger protein [Candidatus Moranbacteria bacterium]
MSFDATILSELKEKLLLEKSRLEGELSRFAKLTGAPGNYETQFDIIGTDTDENATEVEEYVDNIALESNLESHLKDVTDALEKMEKGTYGLCEKTGKEISVERLRAYPAARTAI